MRKMVLRLVQKWVGMRVRAHMVIQSFFCGSIQVGDSVALKSVGGVLISLIAGCRLFGPFTPHVQRLRCGMSVAVHQGV